MTLNQSIGCKIVPILTQQVGCSKSPQSNLRRSVEQHNLCPFPISRLYKIFTFYIKYQDKLIQFSFSFIFFQNNFGYISLVQFFHFLSIRVNYFLFLLHLNFTYSCLLTQISRSYSFTPLTQTFPFIHPSNQTLLSH